MSANTCCESAAQVIARAEKALRDAAETIEGEWGADAGADAEEAADTCGWWLDLHGWAHLRLGAAR